CWHGFHGTRVRNPGGEDSAFLVAVERCIGDHVARKAQEWTKVFVLNTVDGCIPIDLRAGSEDGAVERLVVHPFPPAARTRAARCLSPTAETAARICEDLFCPSPS